MPDEDNLYQDLLEEISILRRRLAELEVSRSADDLTRRNRQLELLNRASQTLVSTLDLDQVLITVLEEVRNELGAVASSIWLLDLESGELVCRHATGPKSEAVVGWRLAPGQGIAGQAAIQGASIVVSDAAGDQQHFRGVDQTTGLRSRSILSVPLRVREDVIGVVQVLDSQPNRFGGQDLQLVESLATTASLTIQLARLYEQANRLRAFNQTIVQSMMEGILLEDTSGHVRFANPEAARLLGYDVAELIGLHWRDIVAPTNWPSVERALAELPDVVYARLESRLITKSGEILTALIGIRSLQGDISSLLPQKVPAGQAGNLIVFTDISNRVKAEDALRASERRYRQLAEEKAVLLDQARQAAETKATLLNEVNHRVKNNLTAIIGLLYAQQRHPNLSDNPAFTSAMKDLAIRIQGLATVHSMLSVSGWKPLRLSDLAEQIVGAALPTLSQEKQLAVTITPSPVRVSPDQAHNLALVINELATNVIKHAMAGRDSGQIHIDIAAEDDNIIQFEFRDDGPGSSGSSPSLDQQTVGLYLVQNIVSQGLHGNLSLRQDKGLKVVIRFPREDVGQGLAGE